MVKDLLNKLAALISRSMQSSNQGKEDTALLALGSLLSNQQWSMHSENINDYEFKIFSQFGDDGIIQYLIKHIKVDNKIFIEFGVENYLESNTRFLLMNNNWKGFVMDGSEEAMKSLKSQYWFWKYSLTNKAAFVNKDNINKLLAETQFANIGILSIDIDGNDYHIFSAIDLTVLNPAIIIVEYNSVLGKSRKISIPYQADFDRTKAHYSNLYFGASLAALEFLASKRGYSLVACNLNGNNAYFVRNDLLNDKVRVLTVNEAYKESTFRESRNRDFSLSMLGGSDRLNVIKGLDVINVESDQQEQI
jgi:hypothetical protein